MKLIRHLFAISLLLTAQGATAGLIEINYSGTAKVNSGFPNPFEEGEAVTNSFLIDPSKAFFSPVSPTLSVFTSGFISGGLFGNRRLAFATASTDTAGMLTIRLQLQPTSAVGFDEFIIMGFAGQPLTDLSNPLAIFETLENTLPTSFEAGFIHRGPGQIVFGETSVEDIQFSISPVSLSVPLPNSFLLTLLGASLLVFRKSVRDCEKGSEPFCTLTSKS